jgi:hypothetical protein
MRKTYRILADIVAIEVVIQAAVMVFAVAGLFKWIDDGNTLSQSVIDGWEDDPPTFTGAIGVFIHGINGQMLIPLLGLALLIVSFFARVPRGVMWATVIFVSIVVQVLAGMFAGDSPYIGLVHGVNAFVLFSAAIIAARAAKPPVEERQAGAVTVAQ